MASNIASNTSVSLDELLDFVRPRHRAILLTRRADGSPQGSPLTCGVDDSGRIVVSTYPERAKTRNAKRDPRVSLIILSDEWNGPWVQIDGTAEVIDSPHVRGAARRVLPEHLGGASGLGRVPGGDGEAGEVDHPGHA